jgi:hypothetical protein
MNKKSYVQRNSLFQGSNQRVIIGIIVLAIALIALASYSFTSADVNGPIFSSINASSTTAGTGATISWNTDEPSSGQVAYGTSLPYSTFSAFSGGTSTGHTINLSNLTPGTMYHFQLISMNASGTNAFSTDQVFMTASIATTSATSTATTTATTTPPTATTTATSTDSQISSLRDLIDALQARVLALENKVAALMNNQGGGTGTTTPPTSSRVATISPASVTLSAGSSIDFNGRGFAPEEHIVITRSGTTIGTAHADGGGNFSTGSMTLGSATSTATILFTGSSGTTAQSNVTFSQ